MNDVLYGVKYVNSIINWNQIEPYNRAWISLSTIDDMDRLDEMYNIYSPKIDFNNECNNILLANSLYDDLDTKSEEEYNTKKCNELNEWYNKTQNEVVNNTISDINKYSFDDALLLIQHPHSNSIISNIICYNTINKKEIIFNEASNVKFLSVRYFHKYMPEPIFFELDRSYYIVGNEILSDIFILRLLKYQTKYYYFDKNYTLEIIDNDINIKTLNFNKYILLEENSYKIKEYEYIDDNDNSIDDDSVDNNTDDNSIDEENIEELDDDNSYDGFDMDNMYCSQDGDISYTETHSDEYSESENEADDDDDRKFKGMLSDIKSIVNIVGNLK